jgi:diguanylate cyclase (GGDEF)-like protein
VARVVALFLGTLVVAGALIAVAVVLLRLIRQDLVAAREAAALLAQTDPLTGVGNRRAFDDAMQALTERDDQVGVVVIDLDDLKLLNDTQGHAAGDEALRLTAGAISSAVRPKDLVSRIGGDEFVVLLTEGGVNRTEPIGARVREAIGAVEIAGFGALSASVGVDVCPGWDLRFGLNRADEMLYEAKRRRPQRLDPPIGPPELITEP